MRTTRGAEEEARRTPLPEARLLHLDLLGEALAELQVRRE